MLDATCMDEFRRSSAFVTFLRNFHNKQHTTAKAENAFRLYALQTSYLPHPEADDVDEYLSAYREEILKRVSRFDLSEHVWQSEIQTPLSVCASVTRMLKDR